MTEIRAFFAPTIINFCKEKVTAFRNRYHPLLNLRFVLYTLAFAPRILHEMKCFADRLGKWNAQQWLGSGDNIAE